MNARMFQTFIVTVPCQRVVGCFGRSEPENREPEALPASENRRLREAIVKVGPALAVPSEPAGTEQPRLGPTLGTLAGSMPVEVLWLAVAFVAIFERLDG